MDNRWKQLLRITLAFLSGMGWVYIYDRRGTIIPPWPGWPVFCFSIAVPALAAWVTYWRRHRTHP